MNLFQKKTFKKGLILYSESKNLKENEVQSFQYYGMTKNKFNNVLYLSNDEITTEGYAIIQCKSNVMIIKM